MPMADPMEALGTYCWSTHPLKELAQVLVCRGLPMTTERHVDDGLGPLRGHVNDGPDGPSSLALTGRHVNDGLDPWHSLVLDFVKSMGRLVVGTKKTFASDSYPHASVSFISRLVHGRQALLKGERPEAACLGLLFLGPSFFILVGISETTRSSEAAII